MLSHPARAPFQTPRALQALVAAAALALCACAPMPTAPNAPANTLSTQQIADLLANPERSAADRNNDLRRKPAQMLAFMGLAPGMQVLDLSTGGGYTTELLARAVGPTGKAYGQSAPPRDPNSANNTPRAPTAPEGNANPVAPAPGPNTGLAGAAAALPAPAPVRRSSAQALAERAKNPGAANIVSVVRSFDDPVPPELARAQLDLVSFMFNYHDMGHMGVDRAKLNAAVFAALKPGGVYVIADHAGRPGTGISEAGSLHRVEEAFVRQEVMAAGFKLAAQADFLRNPNDPRDKNTPEPPQPKDEFVLKFVKP